MAKTDALLASIGGQLTEAEAKTAHPEKALRSRESGTQPLPECREAGAHPRVENLWDKYAVSSRALESGRAETLKEAGWISERIGIFGMSATQGWQTKRLGRRLADLSRA